MALAGEGMKQFLIRLFNLQLAPEKECPSCKVYKDWISQLKINADNESAILTDENHVLREKLDKAYSRLQEDKEAERHERQALEDTILRFTKIKGQPQVVVNTSVQHPIPGQPGKIPIRPGTAWGRMKHDLEQTARDKTKVFREKEEVEIKAGRMAPHGNEDIREASTDVG